MGKKEAKQTQRKLLFINIIALMYFTDKACVTEYILVHLTYLCFLERINNLLRQKNLVTEQPAIS